MSDERAPVDERAPGDERVRLFLALELPDKARSALTRWRANALPDSAGLRLTAPEYLHATLCFLGWRAAADVAPILRACAVLAALAPPELQIGPAIWLPPRRPRVLAVELEDQQGVLAGVQAAASDALAGGGWYTPEKRPYLGHVTVARVGRGARPPRRELRPPASLGFRASQVTLYRSRLSSAGARYESLGTVELGAP